MSFVQRYVLKKTVHVPSSCSTCFCCTQRERNNSQFAIQWRDTTGPTTKSLQLLTAARLCSFTRLISSLSCAFFRFSFSNWTATSKICDNVFKTVAFSIDRTQVYRSNTSSEAARVPALATVETETKYLPYSKHRYPSRVILGMVLKHKREQAIASAWTSTSSSCGQRSALAWVYINRFRYS